MIYSLKLTPGQNNLVAKKTLSKGFVYWYPVSIEGSIFTSLNIAHTTNVDRLIDSWKAEGRIVSSVQLNKDHTCFFYSGSVGDKKIVPIFTLMPLVVRDESIYYYFSENDFHEYYHQIKQLLFPSSTKQIFTPPKSWGKSYRKWIYDLKRNSDEYNQVRRLSEEDLVRAHMSKFFNPGWNITLSKVSEEKCEHCCSIGLNIVLNLVCLLPDDIWSTPYDKPIFIYMLKSGFLTSWLDTCPPTFDMNEFISEVSKLSENKINGLEEIKNFKNRVILNLVTKHPIFKIIYYITRYENSSPQLNFIFDNLFHFIPEEKKRYMSWQEFQPKMFVEYFELHFMQKVPDEKRVNLLKNKLGAIFDQPPEIRKYSSTPWYDSDGQVHFIRYRFICRISLPVLLDYLQLTEFIRQTGEAIKFYINDIKLTFDENQIWLKRIGIKIVLHPNFENNVLLAFSKKMHLISKPDKDIIDDNNKIKILHEELICDYPYVKLNTLDFDFHYIYTELNELLFKDFSFGCG